MPDCSYVYTSGGYGELFCVNGRVLPEMCKGCSLSEEARFLKLFKANPKCVKCGSNEDVVWVGVHHICLYCDRVVKHDPYKHAKEMLKCNV